MSTTVPPRGGGGKPPPRPSTQRPSQRQGKQASFKAKKRRQQQLIAAAAVVVVIAVVAVIIGVKAGGGGGTSGIDARSAIAPSALNEVLGVTPQQMKTAAANIKLPSYPIAVNGAELTSAGKPELLYIGAEYCPYCAGERWAMVMALSKFGTFSGLRSITSSPTDSVASIPTFTFYQSTYTSPYLTFRPVETQTVSGGTLETPSTAELTAEQKYDGPPYVSQGGIPFLDIGGKWIQDGISFNNTAMQHVKFDAMASQVGSQSTPTAGAIAATAGVLISRLCQLTGGKSLDNNAACQAFPTVISKASS